MGEYGSPLRRYWEGEGVRPVVHEFGAREPAELGPVWDLSGRGPRGPGDVPGAVRRSSRSPRGRSRERRRSSDGIDDAVAAVLDKLNRGVLIIDGEGSVLRMNESARIMLAQPCGITVKEGCLEFKSRGLQSRYVAYLASSSDGDGSLVLKVDAAKARGHYRVLLSRLNGGHPIHGVFVYEPAGGPKMLPEKLLRELYGLTAGEARLTNRLFCGGSLVEAATSLGISINTAKAVLKRIFDKCEVRSQTELVQLLSLGPRTL